VGRRFRGPPRSVRSHTPAGDASTGDAGVVIPSPASDIGRLTRTIPDGLRRAVAARGPGCAHPGCDRVRDGLPEFLPPRWIDPEQNPRWKPVPHLVQ
jgi:5-methylcytosine-specific restriction protein A